MTATGVLTSCAEATPADDAARTSNTYVVPCTRSATATPRALASPGASSHALQRRAAAVAASAACRVCHKTSGAASACGRQASSTRALPAVAVTEVGGRTSGVWLVPAASPSASAFTPRSATIHTTPFSRFRTVAVRCSAPPGTSIQGPQSAPDTARFTRYCHASTGPPSAPASHDSRSRRSAGTTRSATGVAGAASGGGSSSCTARRALAAVADTA